MDETRFIKGFMAVMACNEAYARSVYIYLPQAGSEPGADGSRGESSVGNESVGENLAGAAPTGSVGNR